MVYETVNACIRLLASVDLCHIVIIEHIAEANGALHPVQKAMVDLHASQCGFCTPGIVMSLYALWQTGNNVSDADIDTALQGNLCRCTGYRPIIAAAIAAKGQSATLIDQDAEHARLDAMDDGRRVEVVADENRAILPADLDDLSDVLATLPEATIVAGSTDVGLWITKFMRPISPAVFIAHLADLKAIAAEADELTIGAGVTYSEAADAIANISPSLARFWNRIGGPQVRNMGTIGGNIANGSPIGDTPPLLIALGEEISLRQGRATRRIKLQDFFVQYGEQDRAPGDVLTHIHIPRPDPMAVIASHKISKRRDEDISSVCGAILVRLDQGVVADIHIAYGGMAATPKRAAGVERALIGQAWTTETNDAAMLELANDFKPLTDWRASADHRLKVAANLFAAVAAIAAKRFGLAAKQRPDRDDDMIYRQAASGMIFRRITMWDLMRTGAFWRWMPNWPRVVVFPLICRDRSPTARCFTPTMPISSRMCSCARAPRRRIPRPTPPIAVLVARKVLWRDDQGRLRTHAPSTYKIPLASNIPPVFNTALASWNQNARPTIKRSKAVGEPPFMLAISVLEALSMAVSSVADYRVCPHLDTPATPENVLMTIDRLRK